MNKQILVSVTVLLLTLLAFNCKNTDQQKDIPIVSRESTSIEVLRKVTLRTNPGGHFQQPIFSPDNKRIFFTSSNFNGIYYYDLSTEQQNSLNETTGSGYQFVISSDGNKVYYRADAPMVKKRRRFMLYEQNVRTGEIRELLKKSVRNLSPPRLINENTIVFTQGDNMKLINIDPVQEKSVKEVKQAYYCILKNKLAIYESGQAIHEKRFPNQQLLWPDFKAPGNKMLVYLSGEGLQLIDLDENRSRLLGKFRAAKWSPFQDVIVYMHDIDDGKRTVQSDIFIHYLEEDKSVNLTNTTDEIEMYPDWSADGKMIAYQTDRGKIEILELTIK